MPPTSKDFRWRRSPDAPITVSAASFARVVAENDLRTVEADGYLWAWLPTEDGHDTYRTYGPKWKYLYQGRRVNTQMNVAGGALTTRISIPSGVVAKLVAMNAVGPASNTTLTVISYDEDTAAWCYLGNIAAGTTRSVNLPSIGGAASSSANVTDTNGLLIGPGTYIATGAGAALQNETLTVSVALLMSTETEPVWDTTGSAGTPSLAASTISVDNTMQAVLLP